MDIYRSTTLNHCSIDLGGTTPEIPLLAPPHALLSHEFSPCVSDGEGEAEMKSDGEK